MQSSRRVEAQSTLKNRDGAFHADESFDMNSGLTKAGNFALVVMAPAGAAIVFLLSAISVGLA